MLPRVWGNTKIGNSLVPTLASKNTKPRKPRPSAACSFLASHLQQKTETNIMSGVAFRWEFGHAKLSKQAAATKWDTRALKYFADLEVRCTWNQGAQFLLPLIWESHNFRELRASFPKAKREQIQGCAPTKPAKLLKPPSLRQVLSDRPGTHRTQTVARRVL